MKFAQRASLSLVFVTATALPLLTSCGSVSNLAASDDDASASANLTEEAASEAAADADDAAVAAEANTDASTSVAVATGPAYLEVVAAARDYTRALLGLSDAPLKDFKATLAAAKAIATDADDFKARLEPAKAALETALKAQKDNAAKARTEHAAELEQIFVATKNVFVACGADVELKEHGALGKGPKMLIGKGELPGDFKALGAKASQGAGSRGAHRPGRPERAPMHGGQGPDHAQGHAPYGDGSSDPMVAASAECLAATSALQALLPAE